MRVAATSGEGFQTLELGLPLEDPLVSFSVDTNNIYRHVRLRSGRIATSHVENLACSADLAASFDLSWLRSEERPATDEGARLVRYVDLFSGCGAMS